MFAYFIYYTKKINSLYSFIVNLFIKPTIGNSTQLQNLRVNNPETIQPDITTMNSDMESIGECIILDINNSFNNIEENQKLTTEKLTTNDFNFIHIIGKGAYGKVMLVKKKDDGKILAMKILKKEKMLKKNQIQHVKTERKVMELINNPFIIKLQYAFQNKDSLFLWTDYCQGGELFFHIQRFGGFNEEA